MAGKRTSGDLPSWKRWSAAGFFLAGLGLLLLVAFGPLLWGEHFDAQVLKTPALGLIAVAVYVLVGINLPAVDWGGVIARIVTALVSGDDKGKGTGDG